MVEGIFVQKGTLAASFAASATPKKLLPQSSSASSRAKSGLSSSGGSMSNSKARASPGGAGNPRPSRMAGTRPNGTGGPTSAADRLATPLYDRHVDSHGGGNSSSADGGMGERGQRPGRMLEGTGSAFAAGKPSEVGEKGSVVPRYPLKVSSGGESSNGGGGDGSPLAPLSRSTEEQPEVAVEKQPEDAAVAPPAPNVHANSNEGKHAPISDHENSSDISGTLPPKNGENNRDELTLALPKDGESGDGDVGRSGKQQGVGVGGRKGPAAAGDVPPPFELPEMGAAGEGGRSTKDDPAFMKTFFRNSRLHFIGVG